MFGNYGWNVLGLGTDGYITEPERSVGSLLFSLFTQAYCEAFLYDYFRIQRVEQ